MITLSWRAKWNRAYTVLHRRQKLGDWGGARPPHFLQSGGLAPHFCISYCLADIITGNFVLSRLASERNKLTLYAEFRGLLTLNKVLLQYY